LALRAKWFKWCLIFKVSNLKKANIERKNGNSNFRDRIRILKKFIDIFSVDRIEVLVADREFIGDFKK
jgi:hypothetical protein